MANDIVNRERATRFVRRYEWSEGRTLTGELLTMRDGSQWFHPFNGSAPVCTHATSREA